MKEANWVSKKGFYSEIKRLGNDYKIWSYGLTIKYTAGINIIHFRSSFSNKHWNEKILYATSNVGLTKMSTKQINAAILSWKV